jgi:hypothetical protein
MIAQPQTISSRPSARTSRAVARRRGHLRALIGVAAALVAVAILLLARGASAQPATARDTAASVAAPSVTPTKPVANTSPRAKGGAGDRAARAAARPAAGRRADSAATITIEREVFAYAPAGRRDPFKSLLTTSDLRPLLSELRLVGVAVDPAGRNSVAVLRDITTKAQHRVRVGQLLGRMRVSQIRNRAVVFTVEELGFSRQEILALTDSSVARSK